MSEIRIHYFGEIVPRKSANKFGLKRYFTGTPCKNNHIDERQVSNRQCKSCSKNTAKKWNVNNKGKNAIRAKRFKDINPNYSREYEKKRWIKDKIRLSLKRKKYQKENPEKISSYNNKRRKKLNLTGEHFIGSDVEEIKKLQKYKCAYCPKSVKKKWHVDHITPLSKGGDNSRKNIQICCPKCNLTKNAKDPIIFAQEIGKLL